MGSLIDDVSKALASGTSRRAALGALLAGSAASLPWSSEASNQKKRRRFKKYLEYCKQWCGFRNMVGTKQYEECVKKAKNGKGACYRTGPGRFCLDKDCPEGTICCPDFVGGDPVTSGECCENPCTQINGTNICLK
ncbi:MAG: hypothetical protein U0031_07130 [Thermomicrobiales bacterium]